MKRGAGGFDYSKEAGGLTTVRPGQALRGTKACTSCGQVGSIVGDFKIVGELRIDYMTIFHESCNDCRARLIAEWRASPLYSEGLESFWRGYMPSLRAGASGRRIVVAVTYEDVLGLYIQQGGCCAISGLELDWKTKIVGKSGRGNRLHLRPSVDRIDSHGNYTLGNIQIVAQVVNLMKGELPQDRFIALCGLVSQRNFSL